MNTIDISIIIPVYRSEEYIKECILSICAQSFKNFEVILVDNNSDDNSISYGVELLDFNGINYKVVKESEQGQGCAKNRGITEANGEWLCFVDSDDVLNRSYLYELFECAKKLESNVVFCGFSFDLDQVLEGTISQGCTYLKYSSYDISKLFLRRKVTLLVPGMLIRKSLFEDNPRLLNNTQMKSGEDLWQIWMILANNDYVGYCNKRLYGYRRRQGSVTTHVELKRVLSCHEGFVELVDVCSEKFGRAFANQILYRQDFGLVRASAQYSDYRTFLGIEKTIFNMDTFESLLSFPDVRVVILTLLLRISPYLFWALNHYYFKV